MAPARTKKLTKPEVESLIQGLLQSGSINHDALLAFAEKINGSACSRQYPLFLYLLLARAS